MVVAQHSTWFLRCLHHTLVLACFVPRLSSAKDGSRNIVAVLSVHPSALAPILLQRSFPGVFANFSGSQSVTELSVWVPEDNLDGCSHFQSVRAWEPPTAFIVRRGNCTFVQKARNAQEAGAAGLIVAWDGSRMSPMMDGSVTVPAGPGTKLMSSVQVLDYGVLGMQRQGGGETNVGGHPDQSAVIVDPAGLPFITGGPKRAGGASGQIYKFLGIQDAPSFPEAVVQAIQKEGDAKYYAYGGDRHVIHAVGPNFNEQDCTLDEALERLSDTYLNILREFAGSEKRILRLLPMSGGIFAGKFSQEMPELTARALQQGLGRLPSHLQAVVSERSLHMCIYLESDLLDFRGAFTPFNLALQVSNASNSAHDISILIVSVPRKFGEELMRVGRPSSEHYGVVLSVAPYSPRSFDISELVMVMIATVLVVLGAHVSTADLRPGSQFASNQEDVIDMDANLALLLCLIGSVMLVALFRFMKHLVPIVQVAFCIGGFCCTTFFVSAVILYLLPRLKRYQMNALGGFEIAITDPIAAIVAANLVAGWWWFRNTGTGWLYQDVLGSSILCMMQGALRLPNLKIAAFFLVLMFVYDIFWVFISPMLFEKSVMIEVARGGGTGEAMPMLLRVPAFLDILGGESVLGFGDVILPGLLISSLLRHDILTKQSSVGGYFVPSVIGYAAGLIMTTFAVSATGAGQPALLYLVPATLGVTLVLGSMRGDLTLLWDGAPSHESRD